MLVREAMTAPAVTVHPSDTTRHALRLLHEHAVTALPVVDGDGRLVGIVSEIDLLCGEFEPDPRAFLRPVTGPTAPPPSRTVAAVMTSRVLATVPNADVAALFDAMLRARVKSVPVLDGRHVAGVISRSDMVAVLLRDDDLIRFDVQAALAGYLPRPGWRVHVRDGEVTVEGDLAATDPSLVEILARTVPGVVRVTLVPRGGGTAHESEGAAPESGETARESGGGTRERRPRPGDRRPANPRIPRNPGTLDLSSRSHPWAG